MRVKVNQQVIVWPMSKAPTKGRYKRKDANGRYVVLTSNGNEVHVASGDIIPMDEARSHEDRRVRELATR